MEIFENIYDKLLTYPDNKILFCDFEQQLTGKNLKSRIDILGYLLLKEGINQQDKIGIALSRGVWATTAIYTSLLLGGCYVPLDLTNSPERLLYIVQNAGLKIIIGSGAKPDWVTGIKWIDFNCIHTSNMVPKDSPFVKVDCSPENLKVILYTSGSTGKPKGVAIPYRAVETFVKWTGNTFHINNLDKIASLAPFYFDLSLFDLFTGPYYGATIYFMPKALTINPTKLSKWIEQNQISVWYTVPSMLVFWSLKGTIEKYSFPNLRLILFAGEKFPSKYLISLISILGRTKFYNLYGPTETNVCSYWPAIKSEISENNDIPIGIAACNAQLKLDNNGELLVKGPTVAAGYIGNNNILTNILDRDGWYHTGDKCSLNIREEYLFHGRLDRMLKCYGHRIEPGEIESVAYQFPEIKECVVIGVKDDFNNLIPALCFSSEIEIDIKQFKMFLKTKLPSYMNPTKIKYFKILPKLSNGKLDLVTIQQLLI